MKSFLKTKFTASLLCSAMVVTSTLSFAQSIAGPARFETLAQFAAKLAKPADQEQGRYGGPGVSDRRQGSINLARLTGGQRTLLSGNFRAGGLPATIKNIPGVVDFGNAKPASSWLAWPKRGASLWWATGVDLNQIELLDAAFGALKPGYVPGSVLEGSMPGVYFYNVVGVGQRWDYRNGFLFNPKWAGFAQFGMDPLYGITVGAGQGEQIFRKIQELPLSAQNWVVVFLASNRDAPRSWADLQAQGYMLQAGDSVAVNFLNIGAPVKK